MRGVEYVTGGNYDIEIKASLLSFLLTPLHFLYLSRLGRNSVGADFQLVRKLTNYICAKPPELLATQSIRHRHGKRVAQACTIGLSINENLKLEKGKEKKSSAG